ncbi:MAG: hypothetical protein RIQ60_1281 [Pseudomonadota bacterium]|jgi:hypothetical protein
MFGPNSAGKSSVLDAITDIKNLVRSIHSTGNPEWGERSKGFTDHDRFLKPKDGNPEEYEPGDKLLGVEVDTFDTPGTIGTIHDGEWAQGAVEAVLGLKERRVKILFNRPWSGRVNGFSITIDDKLMVDFSDDKERPGIFGKDAAHQMSPELNLSELEYVGILSVRCDPEIWTSDFTEFLTLLAEEFDASHDPVVNTFGWRDGDYIRFRLYSNTGPLLRISESINYQKIKGLQLGLLKLDQDSATLCIYLNEFIRQVHWGMLEHIRMNHVSGDRRRLSPSDTSITCDIDGSIWTGNASAPATLIQEYAIWLASNHPELRTQMVRKDDDHLKQDFVNKILSSRLLFSRPYEVFAEVMLHENRKIAGRLIDDGSDEYVSLTSQLLLRDRQGRPFTFDKVGSGISYILPILTSLWGSAFSWIEQPEIHLHPAAQCEVGDAIVRAFNLGHFSIIETHSEHVLLRILRRIRETSAGKVQDRELACQPEAVAVLYFDPQEDGSTQVHQLRVTRGGDFMDRWPAGFFEERSRELFDE